jgi:hypothetical protein
MIELDENGNIPSPGIFGAVYRLEDDFQEGYNVTDAPTLEILANKKKEIEKYSSFRGWVFEGSKSDALTLCYSRNKSVRRLTHSEVKKLTVDQLANQFFGLEAESKEVICTSTSETIRIALKEAYERGRDSR